MISEAADTLRRSGLDTLSKEAVMRLIKPWTGELHPVSGDSTLTDSLTAVPHLLKQRVADKDVFDHIVEQWRRAREIYVDADASSVFGSKSSLADGVSLAKPVTDTIPDCLNVAAADLSSVADRIANGVADNVALGGADTLQSTADIVRGGVDSLAADSLQMFAQSADTLQAAMPDSTATALDAVLPSVIPITSDVTTVADSVAVIDWTSVMMNIFVAGLTLAYIFCLYRYYDDVVSLMHSVFRRSVIPSERVIERRRSEIFYGFLGKLFMLGTAFVGVLTAGYFIGSYDSVLSDMGRAVIYLPAVNTGLFLAIVAVQYIMLTAVGLATDSLHTVSTLLRIRLIYFVLTAIMAAPLFLIAQAVGGEGANIWYSAGCVMTVISVVLFLRESLVLFVSKKISILHWFLYLCTIEIMPLTLLWQTAVRLRQ